MTTPTLPPLAPPDRRSAQAKMPRLFERKVGWAVVGLGQLSIEEILPAFGACRQSTLVALVSGHAEKAKRLAQVHGVDANAIYDYDGFDRICDDDRIDVVYIVLPNSMHAEFTVRALKAGKHVLCEKPMAASVEECRIMIAAAHEAQRKLMIAYRLHYEPLNRKAADICASGTLGPVKTFVSSNCQVTQAPNIRLSAALAGGPVQDIGIYSINAARHCVREEPISVSALAHRPPGDPRFREAPESVGFILEFPSGAIAHCDCSFGAATSRFYRVQCEKGSITMDPAFAYKGLRLTVREGDEANGDVRLSELPLPQPDQFAAEIDHFSACIVEDREPRTPGAEGLADMKVIEAIARAIGSGRREPIPVD